MGSRDRSRSRPLLHTNAASGGVLAAEIIDLSFVHSQNKAFVDPNDPTVIYIAQPVKPAKAPPS